MTTSASYNYAATATDVIAEALEIVGVLPEGGTATAAQSTAAMRKLNMMIKAWMADDLQLWVAQRATLFPILNTNTYALGPTGSRACVGTIEGTDYIKTTLAADAASGATSLTVTSITGISSTNVIGIILNDGSLHWTTVNGAPAGTTVVITSGLASAADSGKNIYVYAAANIIQRPVRMLEIWRHNNSGVDIPVRLISRAEYDELPYKVYASLTVEAFYNPLINNGPATSNGELQVWPEILDLTNLLQFRYLRPLQDMDATTDDFDFPQEWYLALAYNLAYLLSANYGVPMQDRYLLRKDAQEFKAAALAWSTENTSVFFEPDYTPGQGF